MARVSNRNSYPQDQNLENRDFLVGTDVGDSNATKSYTLEDLRGFITEGLGAALPTEIPLGFAATIKRNGTESERSLYRVLETGAPENVNIITSGATARFERLATCLLYTSPSPRDATLSRMPSSA